MKQIIILSLMSICILTSLSAQGTPGLAYTLIDGSAAYKVSRGTATDANIVIPATYNSLPVRVIAQSGFYFYFSITSVTIPNSRLFHSQLQNQKKNNFIFINNYYKIKK